MDLKKIGIGLGAFAAGAAAWTFGTRRYGDKAADLFRGNGADSGKASGGTGTGTPGSVVPGDSTTSPVAPRPATMAAAPVGMAETDKGFRERPGTPANEHVPTDLLSDTPVTLQTRAPDAFRPDPTAVPSAEEREALRPATGPAPTLVADRGSLNS